MASRNIRLVNSDSGYGANKMSGNKCLLNLFPKVFYKDLTTLCLLDLKITVALSELVAIKSLVF
jgi:hypothetical protein